MNDNPFDPNDILDDQFHNKKNKKPNRNIYDNSPEDMFPTIKTIALVLVVIFWMLIKMDRIWRMENRQGKLRQSEYKSSHFNDSLKQVILERHYRAMSKINRKDTASTIDTLPQ